METIKQGWAAMQRPALPIFSQCAINLALPIFQAIQRCGIINSNVRCGASNVGDMYLHKLMSSSDRRGVPVFVLAPWTVLTLSLLHPGSRTKDARSSSEAEDKNSKEKELSFSMFCVFFPFFLCGRDGEGTSLALPENLAMPPNKRCRNVTMPCVHCQFARNVTPALAIHCAMQKLAICTALQSRDGLSFLTINYIHVKTTWKKFASYDLRGHIGALIRYVLTPCSFRKPWSLNPI